jgi:hypothetical protein
MRQLIPVFFAIMSLFSAFSTRAAHANPVPQDQLVLQATPASVPTSTPEATVSTQTGPPLSLTLILLGMCCVFVLVIGVVVLGFIARNPKKKEEDNSR